MPPHQPDDASLPSLADDLDIVIPTIRSLAFLESWRAFFEPYHLIIIQDGDVVAAGGGGEGGEGGEGDGDGGGEGGGGGGKGGVGGGGNGLVEVPPGFSYERHTRRDIERRLGKDRAAKCISFKDSACRCYGFLVSKKRYIFTIDDDCFVAQTPSGAAINALRQHIRNLVTPATPHYFNTLYDPFAPGADFVRGFPFSMRTGVPTAISHGLWLNVPDYDAPTQLAKPLERNFTHVDAVVTVPKGTLYPMCGMNLAFDRELIGPAMWFGLMGQGQPLGRYDDMWAGWCSKVVCDHLNLGVKSGKPYVWHAKASDPLVNLQKEFKGILWQEAMVDFFMKVKLPQNATTAAEAYGALAAEVKKSALVDLDPYFVRVAEGMETWLEVWQELNPESGNAEGGKEGQRRRQRQQWWLSDEEEASASARGPASAEAVRRATAAARGAPSALKTTTTTRRLEANCNSGEVAAAPSAAPPPPPLPAADNIDADDENTAPFTPQNSAPCSSATTSAAAVKAVAESLVEKAAL